MLLNKTSFYEAFTETSIIKEAEHEKHTEDRRLEDRRHTEETGDTLRRQETH